MFWKGTISRSEGQVLSFAQWSDNVRLVDVWTVCLRVVLLVASFPFATQVLAQ